MPTAIVHTVPASGFSNTRSAIRSTIARIERDTNRQALERWKELYPSIEPAGIFVAKVNVSEIPIQELQNNLPAFQRLLLANGFGLYCIDYTQDFSGVLDRATLVDYLCNEKGFREQGDLVEAMEADTPTVLQNTDSVGNRVCTWVRINSNGYTIRTKKLFPQMEMVYS